MCLLIKLFVLIAALQGTTRAWYTCKDLEFCQNIRNQEDSSTKYSFDENRATITDDSLEVDLINVDNNAESFKLKFTTLKGNTFRLTINDPDKPRHVMADALNGEPKTQHYGKYEKFDGGYKFYVVDNIIEIYNNPFKVIAYKNSNHIITLNSKQKMVFNSDKDAIALDVWLSGNHAYGIPEHAERLALKTTKPGGLDPYRLFNVDYPGYTVESRESLYGSVPVLYSHGQPSTSGIFWLNSAQTFVDIDTEGNGTNTYFISESGAIDLFFFTGPTLEDAVKQYANLTGTAPLPQLFALGFHQSRWSYESQDDVIYVVDNFDKYNFPLDVMWLDIDYTDNIKYFTWNPVNFSNPQLMHDKLESTGRKLVVIIDPHYKVDESYWVYQEGVKNNYFVKFVNGSDYQGNCWPGLSSYIDFFNPQARGWYSSLYDLDKFPNTTLNTYIWNDMNEPSVFDVDEKTMPLNDVQHYGGWLHKDVHNAYGFYQTMGTHLGLLQRSRVSLRPFVLTRSHFAGSQRYTAMWTGDNNADWNYLRISVPMCLTEALAGISFCGADVGGFNNDVEDELFQRWYQTGAWLPFFRAHSSKGTKRREPYLYPEDIQKRLRNALNQRYVHLPYWYTLWWEHNKTGNPVIRPLTYEINDSNTFDIDSSWFVGSNILVSPVMEKGATTISVYLPGTLKWYYMLDDNNVQYFYGGEHISLDVTLDTVPVFYKQGSIIPRKDSLRASTVYMHEDNFSLYVYLDDNQEASGNLYVDDYESFNYMKKEYLYTKFQYNNSELTSEKIDEDANYNTRESVENIYVFGAAEVKGDVYLMNGNEKKVLKSEYLKDKQILKLRELSLNVGKNFKIIF